MCEFHPAALHGALATDPRSVDNIRTRVDPNRLTAEQLPNSILIEFRSGSKSQLREHKVDVIDLRDGVLRHMLAIVEPWCMHLTGVHTNRHSGGPEQRLSTEQLKNLCEEIRVVTRIQSELAQRKNRKRSSVVILGKAINRQIARDDLRSATRCVLALSLIAEQSAYPHAKGELTSLADTIKSAPL